MLIFYQIFDFKKCVFANVNVINVVYIYIHSSVLFSVKKIRGQFGLERSKIHNLLKGNL